MDFSKCDITKSAKRIKEQRKKHGIKTQYEFQELVDYGSRNEISKVENGKMFFSEDRYDKLSRAWGVRKEYLVGMDDYETESEMIKAKLKKFMNDQDLVFALLSSRGYDVEDINSILALNRIFDASSMPLPKSYDMFGTYIFKVTKDDHVSVLLQNDLFELLDDFFALLDKRLKPYDGFMAIHPSYNPLTDVLAF